MDIDSVPPAHASVAQAETAPASSMPYDDSRDAAKASLVSAATMDGNVDSNTVQASDGGHEETRMSEDGEDTDEEERRFDEMCRRTPEGGWGEAGWWLKRDYLEQKAYIQQTLDRGQWWPYYIKEKVHPDGQRYAVPIRLPIPTKGPRRSQPYPDEAERAELLWYHDALHRMTPLLEEGLQWARGLKPEQQGLKKEKKRTREQQQQQQQQGPSQSGSGSSGGNNNDPAA